MPARLVLRRRPAHVPSSGPVSARSSWSLLDSSGPIGSPARPPGFLRVLFNFSLEGGKRLDPETFEVRAQRRDSVWIDRIQAPRARSAVGDQVGALKDAEMLGDCRAAHREFTRQFADGQRPVAHEAAENGPPGRVAEGVELE